MTTLPPIRHHRECRRPAEDIWPAPYEHKPRVMSRTTSLPAMHDMYTARASSPSFAIAESSRPASAASSPRRAVSGMKRPFPLKLASPAIPESDYWSLSTPSRIAIFESQAQLPEATVALSRSNRFSKRPRPQMTIRPKKYRDTPIYNEPGSPALGRAYYAEEVQRCSTCSAPASSCDESCIIRQYERADDVASVRSEDDSLDELRNTIRQPLKLQDYSRNSGLSFQCSGHLSHLESLYKESLTPGHPMNQRTAEDSPRKLSETSTWSAVSGFSKWAESLDMEELNQTTSPYDSGVDFLAACATSVAPARAHVVDVNLNAKLESATPPRTLSSAQSIRTIRGRKSRTVVRISHDESISVERKCSTPSSSQSACDQSSRPGTPDHAMPTPPSSPSLSTRDRDSQFTTTFSHQTLEAFTFPPPSPPPQAASADCLLDTLSLLEASVSNFPATLLLPDSPCVIAMRTHLSSTSFPYHNDRPVVPLSPFSNGVDWRPQHACSSSAESVNYSRRIPQMSQASTRTCQALSSHPVSPRTLQSPLSFQTDIGQRARLAEPNLQPFRNIFPLASDFTRSTLYAHLVAYAFLTSLLPLQPSFNERDSDRPKYVPSKAALMLGLGKGGGLVREAGEFVGFVGGRERRERLERALQGVIGRVVHGCENYNDLWGNGVERRIEGVFLRALVEIVKNDC